ncbi:MAG TPA: glycosyltransferase family 39 protein [Thermomicrobiales bacterium]
MYQWLGAILLLQGGVSLIVLRNSVSQDEALYLTAGRQIASHLLRGGAAPDSYAYRFSGLPYLYPPIAGALDAIGGLELARLLSLLAMLCTTIAVYVVGRSIDDERSGITAAAIFAVQAPTLLIGRLATYDATCLLLLAIATVLALRAGSARTGHLAALVPVPLVLAIAMKYVGELFVPTIIAIMAVQTWRIYGWRAAIRRTAPVLALVGVLLCIGLLILTRADSAGVRLAATTRAVENPLPRSELLRRALLLAAPLSCLAVVGWYVSRRVPLSALLLVSVAVAPAFHLWKAEPVSLQKHIGYGLFFAAPLAGLGATRLLAGTQRQRIAAIALALVAVGLGVEQAHQYYHDWPNDRALIATLRTQIAPDSHILTDDPDILRYELGDWRVDARRRYVGLDEVASVDASGRPLASDDAYAAALAGQYFDLIVIRATPDEVINKAIADDLRDSTHYDLVATVPYATRSTSEAYEIWRKRGAPG